MLYLSTLLNTRFTLFILLITIFSCKNKEEDNVVGPTSGQIIPAHPQVTVLALLPDNLQPKTILPEHAPKPQRIIIQDKPTAHAIQYKAGPQIIQFSPTEKIKAEFSSVMQNYTTEQGLAMDVISCSYTDKKGNLWFGTFTGGVSKYDGKSFTNYSTSQGLTSNAINSIMEDKVGNMWFGTDEGVNKFDGTTFSRFGKFKKVNSILEDSAGNFWFGTDRSGLYKYTGNSFSTYAKSDGLSGNTIYVIKEDLKGVLWIGTENGLSKFDGKTFTNITLDHEWVTTIAIDTSGKIWAGNNYGYNKYDGAVVKNYAFGEEIVPFVFEDHFGNIWLSISREGKLAKYDGAEFSYISKSNGLLFGDIHTITDDKSGNLWFGTAGHGIVKYSGAAFQRLTSNSIRSIFEDSDGNLWFSGYGGAISKFDGEYVTDFKLNIPFWSIFQDRSGTIWMGSEFNGLIKFDQASFTFYTDINGLADNSVMSIMQDSNGNLWIGTRKGVSKFDGKSFTNFTKSQGLAGDYVSCILEDKPGEFWIGTEGGLSFYDGKSFTNYSMSSELIGNDIKSLVKDKDDNLWIGTYGGGLTRYDGKSFYTYTTEQGLPDNVITQVALTKEGYIIAGTNNGIALLTGFRSDTLSETYHSHQYTENKFLPAQNNLQNEDLAHYSLVFEIFNSKTGYPVKDVNRGHHSILLDNQGVLWIATGAEQSGLIRFDYSALNKNNHPPQVNITSVKVDNELICWNDLLNYSKDHLMPDIKTGRISSTASVTEEVTTFGKVLSNPQREVMRNRFMGIRFDSIQKFYPVPQHLILPYAHNNLTIEFGAIEPAKPTLVQYQYKLKGYTKDWSPLSNNTIATFGNIFEGSYQFQLRAQSPDGVWCDPILYDFKVLAPWYRTWWAYCLYGAGFISLMWGIYNYQRVRTIRIERQRTQQREVEQALKQKAIELEMQALRAQMNPHFIFNSLTSINNFILKNDRLQASEYLIKFSKLIRLILENSSSSLISLEQELDALKLYIELESLRFQHRFEYEVIFSNDLDIRSIKVPPLILQPFVENAIHHGLMTKEGPGHLKITITELDGKLQLNIEDNGIGRHQSALNKAKSNHKHKSLGMQVTTERIGFLNEQHAKNSNIEINDLTDVEGKSSGTEICIQIPVIL